MIPSDGLAGTFFSIVREFTAAAKNIRVVMLLKMGIMQRLFTTSFIYFYQLSYDIYIYILFII